MTTNTAPTSHVAVIGLGAWGAALALHCARRGHQVTAWHRDAATISSGTPSQNLARKGPSIALPASVRVTSDLSLCSGIDYCIVALPANAWSEVVPSLQNRVLISATKGLEKSSGLTPLIYAEQKLARSPEDLCVISGPSFASDLVNGTPISLTAASRHHSTATQVAQLLSDNSLRVYTCSDPLGVELGGILKNIIAIAVGMADGLAYGPSTRAALITRGLAEMTRVAVALGAQSQTLFGLSGLGDLVMTATEDQSRNRMVGLRLGRGEKLADILATLNSTAEGLSSAALVDRIATEKGIDAPITRHVVRVLNGDTTPQQMALALMSRPIKSEF